MSGAAVRRRLRLRLTVASFLLSALVVAGAVAGLLGALQVDAASAVRARLHDRVAALAATVDTAHGRVDIAGADDALLDSPDWVFDAAGRRVEGSRVHGPAGPVIARLGRATAMERARVGTLRLLAVPIRRHHRPVAVAVTGVDEAPYLAGLAATTRDALLLGALAVLGATGLAALVLERGLGPMTAMTERAAEWNRHRSGHRFALGPPRDELTGLAAVLDDLLDRVDDALAAERRLTAEIAHELRTPLTVLSGEAELALMARSTPPAERERFARIGVAATAMTRAVTALLEEAAPAPGRRPDADVREAVAAVLAALHPAVRVEVHGPAASVPVPPAHLERILAPILDNAARLAVTVVRVEMRRDGDDVVVEVEDDGPGVPVEVRNCLFETGVTTRADGTGLGLGLARRLARRSGGDLTLLRPAPAVFRLQLPALDRVVRSVPGSVAAR